MHSSSFAIQGCSRTHQQARHSAPGIRNGNCHLRVIQAGHGWYFDGHTRHELRAGQCLILSGDAEGYVSCDPKDPYDFYFISYGGDAARELTDTIIKHNSILFEPDAQHQIIQLCRRIYHLPYSEGHHFNLADALLAEVLAQLNQLQDTDNPSISLNRILRYLENHLTSPIHREQIAQQFQVHPLTLDRLCKQHNGQTIRQIHEAMRMDLARSLLNDHQLSVSSVAHQLGYEDPFHFSRIFKKICGISPKQFQLHSR